MVWLPEKARDSPILQNTPDNFSDLLDLLVKCYPRRFHCVRTTVLKESATCLKLVEKLRTKQVMSPIVHVTSLPLC